MKNKNIMKEEMRKLLVKEVATYYITSQSTLRKTASVFGRSKSWVHGILQIEVEKRCPELQEDVLRVIERNKQERHIRGGYAKKGTRRNVEIKKVKTNVECIKPVIIESLGISSPVFTPGKIYPVYFDKNGEPSFVKGSICDLEYKKYVEYFNMKGRK